MAHFGFEADDSKEGKEKILSTDPSPKLAATPKAAAFLSLETDLATRERESRKSLPTSVTEAKTDVDSPSAGAGVTATEEMDSDGKDASSTATFFARYTLVKPISKAFQLDMSKEKYRTIKNFLMAIFGSSELHPPPPLYFDITFNDSEQKITISDLPHVEPNQGIQQCLRQVYAKREIVLPWMQKVIDQLVGNDKINSIDPTI